MKRNDELSPKDVDAMPLAEFERRFGFRPVDALEKHFFAVNGTRPLEWQRAALEAGVVEVGDLSGVVMA